MRPLKGLNEIDHQTQGVARSDVAGAEGPGKIISIDEGRIKEHLSAVVLEAVEETLNARLNAEAEVLCEAARYERSAAGVAPRAGSCERDEGARAWWGEVVHQRQEPWVRGERGGLLSRGEMAAWRLAHLPASAYSLAPPRWCIGSATCGRRCRAGR